MAATKSSKKPLVMTAVLKTPPAQVAEQEVTFKAILDHLYWGLHYMSILEDMATNAPDCGITYLTMRSVIRHSAGEIAEAMESALATCAPLTGFETPDTAIKQKALCAYGNLENAVRLMNFLQNEVWSVEGNETEQFAQKAADGALALGIFQSVVLEYNEAVEALGGIDAYELGEFNRPGESEDRLRAAA